jgi:ribosomal-protein-alanine N-acetyltransferase
LSLLRDLQRGKNPLLTIEKQIIRPVTKDDIEAISLLEEASFNDPYPSYFLSELARDNPETFLVLSLNNETVAYGVVDHWEDHDHLISIAVRPDSRRKGLGEALLVELEKRLSKERPLKLEVRQSNLAAIQLYSKRGFTKTGVAEGYYGDGENAITMEKVFVKESLVES